MQHHMLHQKGVATHYLLPLIENCAVKGNIPGHTSEGGPEHQKTRLAQEGIIPVQELNK